MSLGVFIVVDQLKMQYGSLWPRASHDKSFIVKLKKNVLTVLYRKAKLTKRIGPANIQICYIGHPTDNLGAMDLPLVKLQKLQNRAARVLSPFSTSTVS